MLPQQQTIMGHLRASERYAGISNSRIYSSTTERVRVGQLSGNVYFKQTAKQYHKNNNKENKQQKA